LYRRAKEGRKEGFKTPKKAGGRRRKRVRTVYNQPRLEHWISVRGYMTEPASLSIRWGGGESTRKKGRHSAGARPPTESGALQLRSSRTKRPTTAPPKTQQNVTKKNNTPTPNTPQTLDTKVSKPGKKRSHFRSKAAPEWPTRRDKSREVNSPEMLRNQNYTLAA